MTDIISADSLGLGTFDTQVQRAANILDVQLGSLEYITDFGIDKRYFLSNSIQFQNDSFKSYLIQVLASNEINVASLIEVLNALDSDYNINLSPDDTSTGLVAR